MSSQEIIATPYSTPDYRQSGMINAGPRPWCRCTVRHRTVHGTAHAIIRPDTQKNRARGSFNKDLIDSTLHIQERAQVKTSDFVRRNAEKNTQQKWPAYSWSIIACVCIKFVEPRVEKALYIVAEYTIFDDAPQDLSQLFQGRIRFGFTPHPVDLTGDATMIEKLVLGGRDFLVWFRSGRVGWTRGSGRVTILPDFGGSGRVSTLNLLVFLLIIFWYPNQYESSNTTFGLIFIDI